MLLTAHTVITGRELLRPGWIEVSEGLVSAVGAGLAPRPVDREHLFNAMRPIDRHEPGPVIALLEDSRVTVELIADGVHVDPATYRHVTHSVGAERVSLVTDAMAATGVGDGIYHLGPLAVDVTNGVARVAGTDTIAGSTATMDQVFRFAVKHITPSRDEALMLAVQQSSINPARALNLPSPALVPGAAADLVVLDAELVVTGVLRRGSWEILAI
jgi:N-acetylglucosamine-6-phosphate deacetylase